MTRLRRVLVLLACVLAVAVLAVVSLLDPVHLRQERWFTSALVALGIILLTATFAVALPRGLLRLLALAVGIAAFALWGFFVASASTLVRDSATVGEVDQGGRRLLTLQGDGPVFAVALRAGSGVLEQESLVYQGLPGAPAPSARFVDDRTVEVHVGSCVYRSAVEDTTLDVAPVHHPIVLGC